MAELWNCLLRAGVLGDGLGALRHGVLGQLTREEEPDSGLGPGMASTRAECTCRNKSPAWHQSPPHQAQSTGLSSL